MNPQRYQEVKKVFTEARRLSPELRGAGLEQSCGDDAELRREVEALLAEDDRPSTPLDAPVMGAEFRLGDVLAAHIPTQNGRYRVLRVLGEGGMGIVYEAEQDVPKRRVAVKMMRNPAGSRNLLRRFEHEIEVLGRLKHPCIAQIYDAGVAESGATAQAYFVMELVEGRPITDVAECQGLGTRARLELAARVCDAVHYAHQRGVIHRDLKPGNIFVVDESAAEARGREGAVESPLNAPPSDGSTPRFLPKILDFGIARVTDADAPLATVQTDVGQLIGSVPYMSPEQVGADSAAIDIRTDVYALGVVLYELLAGRLPHDVRKVPLVEAARIIREDEPLRLSSISRLLRGDLETIVAKAIDKDKAQRYQSAGELAADIRRYLRDEPILARPPGGWYQLSKFARRHKAGVAGAAAVLTTLVAGLVVSLSLYFRAVAARQSADRAANKAQAVNDFLLLDMIRSVDTSGGAHAVKVVDVLKRAEQRIEGRFRDQPEIRAAVFEQIGRMYLNLGDAARAIEPLQRARRLQDELHGPDSREAITVRLNLCEALGSLGRWDEVIADAEELSERSHRALGDRDALTLDVDATWGNALQVLGRLDQAESLLRRVVTAQREIAREGSLANYDAWANLGAVLVQQNKLDDAERVHVEYADATRGRFGPDDQRSLNALNNLGVFYFARRQPERSIPIFREALDIASRALPPGHTMLGRVRVNLGVCLGRAGQFDEAEKEILAGIDVFRAAVGDARFDTQSLRSRLYDVFVLSGDAAKQERWLREEIEIRTRAIAKPDGWEVLEARQMLAAFLIRQRRLADAENILTEIRPIAARSLEPTERVRALIDITWGLFLVQSGRGEAAEKVLLTARASISQLDSPAADKKKLDEQASAALSELRQSRLMPAHGPSE